MSNPYDAPLETADVNPVPGRRFGAVGCGCAVIGLLAFLFISLSALFVSVDKRAQPAPVVVPIQQNTPQP